MFETDKDVETFIELMESLGPAGSKSAEFTGSISIQSEDELRVLVELLCHTKGGPGFDVRIARLRKEAVMKWEDRK